ncbi:hypothetical protein TeGR_g14075, partial [Tetraparma gracilis]
MLDHSPSSPSWNGSFMDLLLSHDTRGAHDKLLSFPVICLCGCGACTACTSPPLLTPPPLRFLPCCTSASPQPPCCRSCAVLHFLSLYCTTLFYSFRFPFTHPPLCALIINSINPQQLAALCGENVAHGRNLLSKVLYDCGPPSLIRLVVSAYPPAVVARNHLGRTPGFWSERALTANSPDPLHALKQAGNAELLGRLRGSYERHLLEREAHLCVVKLGGARVRGPLAEGLVGLRAADPGLLRRVLGFLPKAGGGGGG